MKTINWLCSTPAAYAALLRGELISQQGKHDHWIYILIPVTCSLIYRMVAELLTARFVCQ